MQIQHIFFIISQHVTSKFYIIDIDKLVLNTRSYLLNLFLSLKTPKAMARDHFAKKCIQGIYYIKENVRRKSGQWNF